jgi:hypothetical protein
MYKNKYLKYKNKYLELKNQYGGANKSSIIKVEITRPIYDILISENEIFTRLFGPTKLSINISIDSGEASLLLNLCKQNPSWNILDASSRPVTKLDINTLVWKAGTKYIIDNVTQLQEASAEISMVELASALPPLVFRRPVNNIISDSELVSLTRQRLGEYRPPDFDCIDITKPYNQDLTRTEICIDSEYTPVFILGNDNQELPIHTIFDTGNASKTLLSKSFALAHGLPIVKKIATKESILSYNYLTRVLRRPELAISPLHSDDKKRTGMHSMTNINEEVVAERLDAEQFPETPLEDFMNNIQRLVPYLSDIIYHQIKKSFKNSASSAKDATDIAGGGGGVIDEGPVSSNDKYNLLCKYCSIVYSQGVGGSRVISLEKTHLFIKINTKSNNRPSSPLVIVLRADVTDFDGLLVCNEDIRKLDALNIKLGYLPESNTKRELIKKTTKDLETIQVKMTQYNFVINIDHTIVEVTEKYLKSEIIKLEKEGIILGHRLNELKKHNIVATRK